MNRALMFPALGCALAFAALLGVFRATETPAVAVSPAPPKDSPIVAVEADASRISTDDAREKLVALTGEYLRPWKRWENAREYNYSRVRVGPVPSMQSQVELQPLASNEKDTCLLGKITLTADKQSQAIACVVDRESGQAHFFAEGRWLTQDEWLQQAPIPWRGKWSRSELAR